MKVKVTSRLGWKQANKQTNKNKLWKKNKNVYLQYQHKIMKSLTNSSTVSTENIKTLFQHNYYESILVAMFVVLELTDS